MSLQQKIDYSINLLRRAEPMALRMSDKGFFLAFSGGMDSQCLYHIAKEAKVVKRIELKGSDCNGYIVHSIKYNGVKKQIRAHQDEAFDGFDTVYPACLTIKAKNNEND